MHSRIIRYIAKYQIIIYNIYNYNNKYVHSSIDDDNKKIIANNSNIKDTNNKLIIDSYYIELINSINSPIYGLICYDLVSKNPKYVYERIIRSKKNSDSKSINRKHVSFHGDNNINEEIFKIKPKDYTDSSFDRGHMIPAADFSHSQEALASTFTMANICPQDPHLNKNYWAKFESWIRFLFYHNKGNEVIEIFTGPVYAPNFCPITKQWKYNHNTIGYFPKLIKIPTHFFKVIRVKRYEPNIVNKSNSFELVFIGAFLIPNEPIDVKTPISNYLIKVEQLEMIAGLKFFPNDLSDVNREFLDSLIPDSRDIVYVLNPSSIVVSNKFNFKSNKDSNINHLCNEVNCMKPFFTKS